MRTGHSYNPFGCPKCGEVHKHGSKGRPRPPGVIEKIRIGHLGKRRSSESIEKQRQARKGRKDDPEVVKKRADAIRGRPRPQEVCEKIRQSKIGKKQSPEFCQHCRENQKRLWKDPEYVKLQMSSRKVRQNKAEKLLETLINQVTSGFQFTGDGKKIVCGKCPDFINDEKHLIIELFGDYWHKPEEASVRVELFRVVGYQTLVIWEHELKDVDATLSHIEKFIQKGHTNELRD